MSASFVVSARGLWNDTVKLLHPAGNALRFADRVLWPFSYMGFFRNVKPGYVRLGRWNYYWLGLLFFKKRHARSCMNFLCLSFPSVHLFASSLNVAGSGQSARLYQSFSFLFFHLLSHYFNSLSFENIQ